MIIESTSLMWYWYNQNNSGGMHEGPALNVYVEARTTGQANAIAEEHDVYFDGIESGRDCSCCGSRWRRARGEGELEPLFFGDSLELTLEVDKFWRNSAKKAKIPMFLLIYSDGRKEEKTYENDK